MMFILGGSQTAFFRRPCHVMPISWRILDVAGRRKKSATPNPSPTFLESGATDSGRMGSATRLLGHLRPGRAARPHPSALRAATLPEVGEGLRRVLFNQI